MALEDVWQICLKLSFTAFNVLKQHIRRTISFFFAFLFGAQCGARETEFTQSSHEELTARCAEPLFKFYSCQWLDETVCQQVQRSNRVC